MHFLKEFKNKKILIFGYGKTGKSVRSYFIKNRINHTIWDDNRKLNIKNVDKKYYLKKYDYIILSPGVDVYHHQNKDFFKKHKKNIITDLDIFFLCEKKFKYIVGVTGTNGKSSFCNLLYNLTKKNNIKSSLLGNFGNPVLNVNTLKKEYCILELSSYQLDYSKYIRLDSACILNISADHLDRHETITKYKKIKLKIFNFLKSTGVGFYQKKAFPKLKKRKNIQCFDKINKTLIQKILKKNILISKNDLKKNNLPHRYEMFHKMNNFKFIDDSKSTNFDSTRYALKLTSNSILISGGLLKKGDNFFLKDLQNKIIKIYLFGNDIGMLKKSLEKQKITFNYFLNLKDLLKYLFMKDYKELVNKKKIFNILFSPGAASFDQFKNFEQRGKIFKKYVYKFFKR
tara:strand:+ start:1167 stop:2366 length:1200 start_codon:yes stop_codon:yes gene_type:complete